MGNKRPVVNVSSHRAAICVIGIVLGILSATPSPAGNDAAVSDPCATAAGSSPDDLEKQRRSLENAVAVSSSEGDALLSATNRTAEALQQAKQKLADDQTRLIDAIYRIDCFRPDLERTEEVLRGSPAKLNLSLFYATNRRATESKAIDDFYGYDDTRSLAYGTTTVSIPSLHRPGE